MAQDWRDRRGPNRMVRSSLRRRYRHIVSLVDPAVVRRLADADRLEYAVELRVVEHQRDQSERREERGRSEVTDARTEMEMWSSCDPIARPVAYVSSCAKRSIAADQSADRARPA
ncbi:hypothetical protein QA600_03760 [Natronococcus sp. A-GB1]|uniref:hypothetical protein n=1 Tax=Natronococcus sp. A-GB1 TaxID=3037648 RepID=UPI00241EE8A3|nr:hypothetical protein [Natronococcus sp. A-GB1]MDG5758451.1 hypothetical protein [Natronococcus sp. A-GB1]